ncbi:MAG: PqqD family protein [Sphingobacteriaceae bacterium]
MKLKSNLTLRKVGSDYIIVQPDQGVADLSKVFSLNDTAAYVWEAVQDKEFDLEHIKNLLTDRFDVDDATAFTDGERLVELFKSQNLLAED